MNNIVNEYLFKSIYYIYTVHSYVFNSIPTAISNTWLTVGQFRGENPNFDLRNDNEYYLPGHRTELISRMPLLNLPRTWNQYSHDLAKTNNKNIYSRAVTTYFLHYLSSMPNCTRLVCPS
jgi:hypothetical protein